MDESESNYRKSRYDAYIKEREALRRDLLEISGRYDKAILALAGGALALSITFLEKIAPHPSGPCRWLLGIAWLFLIAALLLELHALALGQTLLNLQIVKDDEIYREYLNSLPEAPPTASVENVSLDKLQKSRKRLRRINFWSQWTLILGVVLLCIFSLCNLPSIATEDSTMSDSAKNTQPPKSLDNLTTSRGSYAPPASALPPPPPPAAPPPPPAAPSPASTPAPTAPVSDNSGNQPAK